MKQKRFIVNGDGTVTDTSTGLIWQQQASGLLTWGDAISYCEGLSLSGYNNWRPPIINELQSLVDYTRYNPAIDTTAFPDTMSSVYWSSSTDALIGHHVWCVYFYNGNVFFYNKLGKYYMRAVRGGENMKQI